METVELPTPTGSLVLAGVCEGLESETDALAELLRARRPEVLAVALEPGAVEESVRWEPSEHLEGEDVLYERALSAWGPVQLPPPEYGVAIQLAEGQGARVVGVDISESHYADLFTDKITMWELWKRSRRLRKLDKRPPEAGSAEELCRAFDAAVNQGAFADLEAHREDLIAGNLREIEADGLVVALVPVARLEGIHTRLQAQAGAPRDR